MGYLPDAVIDALRGSVNLGIFFRLGTTPPLHLWMGTGDCPIGIAALDPAGTVYRGAGRLLGVPDLDLLVNGQGDQIEFGLSGVDADFLETVSNADIEVRGAKVHVGIATLNDRWQPTTSIIPLRTGTADHWSISQEQQTDPTRSSIRSISLSVGVGDTSRAQPRNLTWTDQCQKALHAGDRFCERVSRYVQSLRITWPHY